MPNSEFDGLQVVYSSRYREIECLTLFNPPVNALTSLAREELLQAVEKADGDKKVRAIVIAGDGHHFCHGADIREFLYPACRPAMHDLCNRIAACDKPVIASIRGGAYGNGLEIALAAHYRVATQTSRFALPDIQVNIVPAGGGAVRASLLLGVSTALELMLAGNSIDAAEAATLGLVDRVGPDGNSEAIGVAFANEILAAPKPTRFTNNRKLAEQRNSQAANFDGPEARSPPEALAGRRLREIVMASAHSPIQDALTLERKAYAECTAEPQFPARIKELVARHRLLAGHDGSFTVVPRETATP